MDQQKRLSLLLFFIVIGIGIVWTVILLLDNPDSLLFYGDAVFRLVKSRLIWDNSYHVIYSIGSVWLPLPYFLFLPFTYIDNIFFSGLAGTFVSLPLLALGTVFVYKSILLVTNEERISILVAIVFAINPNMLYLSITGMVDSHFIAFFLGSFYFLLKWLKYDQYRYSSNLNCASLFISLACLVRYEGWLLAIFLNILIFIIIIFKRKELNHIKRFILTLSILNSSVLLWFIWNNLLYQDPFYFLNAEFYSTAWQAKQWSERQLLLNNIIEVVSIYGLMCLLLYGPIVILTSIFGLFSNIKSLSKSQYSIVILFLLLPALSTLWNLYSGTAVMKIWLNARYVFLLYPLVVIFLSNLFYLIGFNNRTRKIIIYSIFGLIIISYIVMIIKPEERTITLVEARAGYYYKIANETVEIGNYLNKSYDCCKVLLITGSTQGQKIMMASKKDFINFHIAYHEKYSSDTTIIKDPREKYKWIVLAAEPEEDAKIIREVFLENLYRITNEFKYREVFRNKYFVIYKKED